MRDGADPAGDDALRGSVAEALRTMLARSETDQAAAEVLKTLRWQLAKALAEAPMTGLGVEEISFRARLAAAFDSAIDAQEAGLTSPTKGSTVDEMAYRQKRRWPRYPVHLNAEVSTGASTFNCVVVDMSTGGAQVKFTRPVQVSELVTLRIKDRGTYLAWCRWTNGARAGFEFGEAI